MRGLQMDEEKVYEWGAYRYKPLGINEIAIKVYNKSNREEIGMNVDTFSEVIEGQMERCRNLLMLKAEEYATGEDRLHNFNVASELQGVTRKKALAGMMAKHTVSIYDMCKSDESYPEVIWNEKITDHINYLLLLKAVIMDGSR